MSFTTINNMAMQVIRRAMIIMSLICFLMFLIIVLRTRPSFYTIYSTKKFPISKPEKAAPIYLYVSYYFYRLESPASFNSAFSYGLLLTQMCGICPKRPLLWCYHYFLLSCLLLLIMCHRPLNSYHC